MTDYVGKLSPNFNEPPPPYTSGPGQVAPPTHQTNGTSYIAQNVSTGTRDGIPIHTVSGGYVHATAPAMTFVGGPVPSPTPQVITIGAGQPLPPNLQVNAVIVNVAGFGPHSTSTTCTSCNTNVMTETRANPGLLTWILSGTLLLIGCWAGCCLIPCCITDCQDIEHRCPNCKAHLGTYRRI